MDVTIQKLQSALDQLPKDSTAIAKFLEEKEIKGYVRDAISCPISTYLRQTLSIHDADFGVYSSPERITIMDSKHPHPKISEITPVSVSRFISLFDQGFFPKLKYELKSR